MIVGTRVRHAGGRGRMDHRVRRARGPSRGANPATSAQLRARVLLEEARALGLDLADLIAADTAEATPGAPR